MDGLHARRLPLRRLLRRERPGFNKSLVYLFSFITAKLVHEPDKIVEARPGRQGKASGCLNDLLGTVPAAGLLSAVLIYVSG